MDNYKIGISVASSRYPLWHRVDFLHIEEVYFRILNVDFEEGAHLIIRYIYFRYDKPKIAILIHSRVQGEQLS